MKKLFISKNVVNTFNLAYAFANLLKGNETIAMFGDLGAGKTTFTKALCQELGIDEEIVTSPTFSLVNEYNGTFKVYHFDMYRITTEEDLESIGFFDDTYENAVKIIEWSENIIDFIEPDFKIYFEHPEGEDVRYITIERGEE